MLNTECADLDYSTPYDPNGGLHSAGTWECAWNTRSQVEGQKNVCTYGGTSKYLW